MCEACYLGDKLKVLADPDVGPEVGIVVLGSSFRAVEYELGRRLE